jgi:hypothetical protein
MPNQRGRATTRWYVSLGEVMMPMNLDSRFAGGAAAAGSVEVLAIEEVPGLSNLRNGFAGGTTQLYCL